MQLSLAFNLYFNFWVSIWVGTHTCIYSRVPKETSIRVLKLNHHGNVDFHTVRLWHQIWFTVIFWRCIEVNYLVPFFFTWNELLIRICFHLYCGLSMTRTYNLSLVKNSNDCLNTIMELFQAAMIIAFSFH